MSPRGSLRWVARRGKVAGSSASVVVRTAGRPLQPGRVAMAVMQAAVAASPGPVAFSARSAPAPCLD